MLRLSCPETISVSLPNTQMQIHRYKIKKQNFDKKILFNHYVPLVFTRNCVSGKYISCRKILETYICGFQLMWPFLCPCLLFYIMIPWYVTAAMRKHTNPKCFPTEIDFQRVADESHFKMNSDNWNLMNHRRKLLRNRNSLTFSTLCSIWSQNGLNTVGCIIFKSFLKISVYEFSLRKKNNVLKWLYFGENFQRR